MYISGTCLLFPVAFNVATCRDQKENKNTQTKEVAGNEEVPHFMKTFDGRGALSDGNLGPGLTGYDCSNLNDPHTNIVNPSAYIREGYVAHGITTADGHTIVGTLKQRNESLITIQPFSGDPVNISTSLVNDIQEQKTSITPEKLLSVMTDQEVKDIASYLMKPDNN